MTSDSFGDLISSARSDRSKTGLNFRAIVNRAVDTLISSDGDERLAQANDPVRAGALKHFHYKRVRLQVIK
jgi:hypothetical protein